MWRKKKEKNIDFYRKIVEINGMAIAWDVFDFYDKAILLDTTKPTKGFRLLFADGATTKKLLLEQFN